MRLSTTALVLLIAAPLAAQHPTATAPPPPSIRGFARDQLATEMSLETKARAVPSADTLRALLRRLSAVPHEAGTERSHAVALQLLERFRAFGLNARIEQFEALMPRPVSRSLELVAPVRFVATLREPPVPGDSASGQPDQLPTFNAYSPDGDVTADLVYVNYGRPSDYHVLDSLGISVQGKIVIARYGGAWRGIKPKVAAEHGAIGCIIYSDPRDDGYWSDDTYPAGPMRPDEGVQRGSVLDMPIAAGDPLTPGWASVPGTRRLSIAEATTLPRIPVLPISYGDALPLLRQLRGPVAPEPWRGALPITYHVGPGPARVHLAVKFDWQSRPLYDVIATIPGSVSPEQWVVYGNHHDAWVNGAEDPLSGQIALNETARALGVLVRSGWRPLRTIVFAAWDGEEWGLLGSTEWAERHAAELRDRAVVYYNSDTNDPGWLEPGGSHSLEQFMREVARDVPDPKTGRSVLDAYLAHKRERRSPHDTTSDTTFVLAPLGSGSDYTPFLQHLAVPSINLGFGGAVHTGIYHSIYDNDPFYERYIDSTFTYGVALAQTMVTAMLRMANAPLLPFEFTTAARSYRRYATEIEQAADSNDTTKHVELSGVRNAIARLDSAAAAYDGVAAGLDTASGARIAKRRESFTLVNRVLAHVEQALADTAVGLPRRPWFTHLIYAPGAYTGYDVKTMPGIREAVEQRHADEAQAQAARVAAALDAYTRAVREATEDLRAALY
ncbi:MAG TPA: transferrin receptor-like dimerization domain-containing protein [Gemmatimonadales bacterium]|nr:transferrin receptor-like dimerization domain-containing protein [Gemmatimonadales bacterium]